jgi:F-type H+-transporting ATPase subunit beta
MNEPPGLVLVWHSGLSIAEYFRDGQELIKVKMYCSSWIISSVLQAGSEVSALLGRMPSAVGYQPTLLQMGAMQGVSSTTKVLLHLYKRFTCG